MFKLMNILERIVAEAINDSVTDNNGATSSSDESEASTQAHRLGLVSGGFGYWKDQTGKTVARTVQGHLVKLDPHISVARDIAAHQNANSEVSPQGYMGRMIGGVHDATGYIKDTNTNDTIGHTSPHTGEFSPFHSSSDETAHRLNSNPLDTWTHDDQKALTAPNFSPTQQSKSSVFDRIKNKLLPNKQNY
jgi:hypothetical protein